MSEYELYHHGILGMKWGVRRTPEQLGHRPTRKERKAEKREKKREQRRSASATMAYGAPLVKAFLRNTAIGTASRIGTSIALANLALNPAVAIGAAAVAATFASNAAAGMELVSTFKDRHQKV